MLRSVAVALDDDELARLAAGPAAPVTQLVEEIAARLGHRSPVTGDDPSTLRFLLYEAVATFLLRAAADRPLVVALDDVQWADVASLELLAHLAPLLATAPLLVAAAYRDLPTERTAVLDATLASVSREEEVEEVTLHGLARDGVATLTAEVLGSSPSEELVRLLHERTGGNPFFVRQLARWMSETAGDTDPSPTTALPPGVRHVLSRRLQALPEPARHVLDAAAVVGRDVDLRVVAAAAAVDLDTALDVADVAARHGLAERHGETVTGCRFVHALVQEVVYEELPPSRVARLHARVAEALEAVRAPVDQLAEHLWRAADLVDDDRPLRYTLAAADRAAEVLAYDQAERYLRRALRLAASTTPHDPQVELAVRLRLFHVVTAHRGWGVTDARDLVARARALVADTGLRPEVVQLCWSLWTVLVNRDEVAAVDELAAEMSAHARADGDPVALAAAWSMSGFRHLHRSGGQEAAVRELRRARQAADEAPAERLAAFPEHLGVMVRLLQAHAAALGGDAGSAAELGEEAVALADADGRPFPRAMARTFLSWTGAFLPDPRQAVARAEAAHELNRRYGFRWLADLALPPHAWGVAHLGADPAGQAERVSDAVEAMRVAGHHGSEVNALLLLAEVLLLAGDVTSARDRLMRARTIPGGYAVLLDRVEQALDAARLPPVRDETPTGSRHAGGHVTEEAAGRARPDPRAARQPLRRSPTGHG